MSTLVDLPGGRLRLLPRNAFFFLFFFSSLLSAGAQHANGRGAMSAQDMAAAGRVSSAAAYAADPADPVCARFAIGNKCS